MVQSLVANQFSICLFCNEHKLYFSLITSAAALPSPYTHRSHRQIKAVTSDGPYGSGSPPGLICDVTTVFLDCCHGIALLFKWSFPRWNPPCWDLGGCLCVRSPGDPPPFYSEGLLVLMPSNAFGSSTTLYIYGHVPFEPNQNKNPPFLQGSAWGPLFSTGLPV